MSRISREWTGAKAVQGDMWQKTEKKAKQRAKQNEVQRRCNELDKVKR